MGTVETIPSAAFARGAVVRRGADGPNMLVVRSWPDETCVVAVEGQADGTLRLRGVPTAELRQVLPSQTPEDGG